MRLFNRCFCLFAIYLVASSDLAVAQESLVAKPLGVKANATSGAQTVKYKFAAQARNGNGYGVAKLVVSHVPLADQSWGVEQLVQVTSPQCEVWFPVCVLKGPVGNTSEKTAEIYFLFHNGFPSTVDLHVGDQLLAKDVAVSKGFNVSFSVAVSQWWQQFSNHTNELAPAELKGANQDLLNTVGNLLALRPLSNRAKTSGTASQLEKEFERTLGMLLGFESVRLAMMTDNVAQTNSVPANLSLPRSLNLTGVTVPKSSTPESEAVPGIAKSVPSNCYFVHCKSIENYLWLRGLLMDWGGSLDELVANSAVATDIRTRLEKQLVLNAQSLAAENIDSVLDDMAVIGSDLLFHQGAGVGVLMRAKPGAKRKLEQILEDQRATAGVRSIPVNIQGHQGTLLSRPDNKIRSYYFLLGNVVLITNSSNIAKSVIQTQASTSLADLAEFKYAWSRHADNERHKILFYLSDPFFRRLASTQFRIELGRRRSAESDCRRMELAAMLGEATGHSITDLQSMIDAELLPRGFGQRADGSRVEFQSGAAYDTLRGKPGTFIPVVDVEVKKCNYSEQRAYAEFVSKYRTQWQVMDPVLATLDAFPLDAERDRLNLKVHITPYARGEYQFLTQYLGSPSTTYVSAGNDELMGVTASLRTAGKDYHAHLGILDSEQEYSVKNGQVWIDGKEAQNNFVTEHSFAAVNPSGTQGLLALNGLMKSLQKRKPIKIQQPVRTASFSPSYPQQPKSIWRTFLQPQELLIRAGIVVLEGASKAAVAKDVSMLGDWLIYGKDRESHSQLRNNLVFEEALTPAEIHAEVKDVQSSLVASYLNAYTFCEARRKSGKVAAWLNYWTSGLNADPVAFRRSVQSGVGGTLVCPLGGSWLLSSNANNGTRLWSGAKWQEASWKSVNRVPDDYQFAFLDWFKGLDLRFSLTRNSLESDIYVDYKPTTPVSRAIDEVGEANADVEPADTDTKRPLGIVRKKLEQPREPEVEPTPLHTQAPREAAATRRNTQAIPLAEIGIKVNPHTMVVSVVKPGMPASKSQLRAGDKILSLNGMIIRTLDQLRSGILAAADSNGIVKVLVNRGGREVAFEIELESQDVDL